MKIFGVDFTSAPCRGKAITVAAGRLKGMTLAIQGIERLETFSAFEALLARPGPWIGGFDFPFGLPAELCRDLGWPLEWKALVSHCSGLTRQQRSEEHTSELQSLRHLVCRLLLEKKKKKEQHPRVRASCTLQTERI